VATSDWDCPSSNARSSSSSNNSSFLGSFSLATAAQTSRQSFSLDSLKPPCLYPFRFVLRHTVSCNGEPAGRKLLCLPLAALGDVRCQHETILVHELREPTLLERCAQTPGSCPPVLVHLEYRSLVEFFQLLLIGEVATQHSYCIPLSRANG
jgi:hypothetical protein